MDKESLRKEIEQIVDTMLGEQRMVNKIGQKPFDKAADSILELVHTSNEQHAAEIKREYALKGADAVLEDLGDWMESHDNITVLATYRHISTMIGHVELKKIDPNYTLSTPKEKTEQYQCPSYWNNGIKDCTCGKCGEKS